MRFLIVFTVLFALFAYSSRAELERILYKDPELVVDLGVGLWAQPLPMDVDGDDDLDMVLATADVPYNGIYVFENPGTDPKYPVFKKARRLSKAEHNICISYLPEGPLVLTPDMRHPNFLEVGIKNGERLRYKFEYPAKRTRAKQWKLTDLNGDSLYDLIIGLGVWDDYGWDNAYNEKGEWTNGPLHGNVFLALNRGTNESPVYAPAEKLLLKNGDPVDVYGAPSPNFADWDGDGDLDLICGEFLDRITYFENTGTKESPKFKAGQFLQHNNQTIRMELEMLQVVAVDWDKDGHVDLIVGQEDGRVALMECTGELLDNVPQFLPPQFFQQEADAVKIGALCTPFSVDWDKDGDEDLIVGDTAGFINLVENLDGGNPPAFAPPVRLKADGETIRIQAGENGSIQGPCEAKWGYTAPTVADWNGDGLLDIVCNSIWGRVIWFEGVGTPENLQLKAAHPVEVEWEGPAPKPAWNWWNPQGKELVTQWRTTPFVYDLNMDGLVDLIMLDTEGYLAFYERAKKDDGLVLLPGKRIFQNENGETLRLNDGEAGKSGRRKFTMCDWDGDGKVDLILNSKNAEFWRNVSNENGIYRFQNMGDISDHRLAGHTTSPTVVDWNKDNKPELLIGAEDGFLYYMRRV